MGNCLEINHLEKVEQPEDAERAKLRDNPDLRVLSLSWDHADTTEYKIDAEVLENLIPPRTLEGFELAGYRSTNFPNWMLEISTYPGPRTNGGATINTLVRRAKLRHHHH